MRTAWPDCLANTHRLGRWNEEVRGQPCSRSPRPGLHLVGVLWWARLREGLLGNTGQAARYRVFISNGKLRQRMRKANILRQNGNNFLWLGHDLWMWDIPVERRQQKSIADQAFGEVLVAGYGLGLVQHYLSRNPKVKAVTTIEKYPGVIREVRRVYRKLYGEIVIADFYRYRANKKYDCIIGDIWEDITELTLPQYNRFVERAKLFIKPGGVILAWGKGFFDYLNATSGKRTVMAGT